MRIKLDENLPAGLAASLAHLGHDVHTVPAEGLRGRDDDVIWNAAQSESRFLVTQDLDFSDARRFAPGSHHGILLVRVPDNEQWRVGDWVLNWLSRTDAASWKSCFVVASPRKVRVLRPPDPAK
jgi:predicted nuclease of predicted toxin-antitoxin system